VDLVTGKTSYPRTSALPLVSKSPLRALLLGRHHLSSGKEREGRHARTDGEACFTKLRKMAGKAGSSLPTGQTQSPSGGAGGLPVGPACLCGRGVPLKGIREMDENAERSPGAGKLGRFISMINTGRGRRAITASEVSGGGPNSGTRGCEWRAAWK
jgi:hypothetical protein